ncbi:hypothetical protein L1049_004060 [Liquidambar formosana]|uniref:Uncharacterized protein n=1 Tax=Liquidambar formosana TaxID=63359 RepID=A0AAP0RML5_LIQFO
MQLQFKETKVMLMKEREASKRASEQIPVVKEVPVIDHAVLEKLMGENEKLKALVSSLEKKIDETEKKYEETTKISEERLKQALEAESKIVQLKTSMQRLEEKFSDMESENKILRQQTLLSSPVKRTSEHPSTLATQEPQSATPAKKFGTESDSSLRRSHIESQHENVDALIKCVMKNIGFSNGKPVAAFTIYKCLLHWKSFEAERTSVFDRLIQMIGSAIENQDSNDHLAYWLSNTSALLFLLQRSLKASGATSNRKPPAPTSLFGRMTMGFRSSPSSANLAAAGLDVVRQVEAKYPALLFKQQLTAFVEKMYGIIRDNLKKELSSLLSLCIQAPRTSKGSALRSGRSFGKDSPSSHWQSIIESLSAILSILKENFVPPILVQKIFTQVFSYINVQLFNSLLLRRECCTFSNGEYVKAGLAELELWCCHAKEEYAGSSWDELKHIRQAVGFLVIHQKYRISYDEITNDLCPVISSMRVLMTEDSNNAVSSSFLLDDTSSIGSVVPCALVGYEVHWMLYFVHCPNVFYHPLMHEAASIFNSVVGSLVRVEYSEAAWIDGKVEEVNGLEIKVRCTSEEPVTVEASNVYLKEAEFPPCGVDDKIKQPKVLRKLESKNPKEETYVAAVNLVVGSLVWLKYDAAWIDGEVVKIKGDWIEGEVVRIRSLKIEVLCKTVRVKDSNVYHKGFEAPPSGSNGKSTKVATFLEHGVLQYLEERYSKDEIYTYDGNVLIAVNPCKQLPHLYNNHMMEQYKGSDFGELSPHPFAIADATYRRMIHERKNQSVLIMGESGAGKTETAKKIMDYLAYVGGRAGPDEGNTIEKKVVESNPVLEAFGNAATERNNNASRFGKLVKIHFDQEGRISGAAISTHLLEKSRVCWVSDPERNYHCFYMLCAAPPEDIERYKLGNPRLFRYLNKSNCYKLDGVDDSKEYLATRNAMGIVGISPDEQDAIFGVVAAILHLGNIEFKDGKEPDSSQLKDEKSCFHLTTAAKLFRCSPEALKACLLEHLIEPGHDKPILKKRDPVSAAVSRDSLAKTVYARLFTWIVRKINSLIGPDDHSKVSIGVLDISGFEICDKKANSFEQFCINWTNEKLQQHFNQHVFKKEKEECKEEGIDCSYINFVDNQDILDLIEKKPGGIVACLNEACMFPESTHEAFAQKLYQNFNYHKRFSRPKVSHMDFTISHYAAKVSYRTELFLDKNKGYHVVEHQELLNDFIFSNESGLSLPISEGPSKKLFSPIVSQFEEQLHDLIITLSATEPHYIRCVKPNKILEPENFESTYALEQLQCGGVMEAIRISCAGYPTRKPFKEFVDRFHILAPEVSDKSYDEKTSCERILKKEGLRGYQALVGLLENKIEEMKKKHEETNRISEEKLMELALEAESKIEQLKTAIKDWFIVSNEAFL